MGFQFFVSHDHRKAFDRLNVKHVAPPQKKKVHKNPDKGKKNWKNFSL